MAKLSKRSIKLNTLTQCVCNVVNMVTQGAVLSMGFQENENENYFVMEIESTGGETSSYLYFYFASQDIDYIIGALSSHVVSPTFLGRLLLLKNDPLIMELSVAI